MGVHCDTYHDTVNKMMTQVFSEKVKLIYSFANNTAYVEIDGMVKSKNENMNVYDFMRLQEHVQAISDKNVTFKEMDMIDRWISEMKRFGLSADDMVEVFRLAEQKYKAFVEKNK
jgi:hypothetical protein